MYHTVSMVSRLTHMNMNPDTRYQIPDTRYGARRMYFMLEPKGLGFKSLYPTDVSRDNSNAQKKPAKTAALHPRKVCSGIGCNKVSRGSRLLDGHGKLVWAGCSSCAKRQTTPSGHKWKRYLRQSKQARLRAAGL